MVAMSLHSCTAVSFKIISTTTRLVIDKASGSSPATVQIKQIHHHISYRRGNSLLPLDGEFGIELLLLQFLILPAEPGRVSSSTTVHCRQKYIYYIVTIAIWCYNYSLIQ